LASPLFTRSERLSRFLRFIVERTLAGQADTLKEYVLAVEVYDKDQSYQPGADTLVRVEAGRLRNKLREYYESEGKGDPVRLELPKGSYVPVFRWPEPAGVLAGETPSAESVPAESLRPASPPAQTTEAGSPGLELKGELAARRGAWVRRRVGPLPSWAMLGGAGLLVAILLVQISRWQEPSPPGRVQAKVRRIAVLPLENLSGDPNQEYFTDGLTDDLITTLGQIKALNVISRRSVVRYKGSNKPLAEIARELNVDHVVEATAARAANQVRINVRLVEAASEQPVWSQSYQRNLRDILQLQDEVTRAIAREIAVKLTPQEEAGLSRNRPVNPQAYEAYQMGQFHFNKRTAEGYRASLKYYQQAIEADPNYALAYAGLAFTYVHQAYSLAGDLPAEEVVPKARAAAMKALELDDTVAQAHTALGMVYHKHDYDWARAEKELRRAIELNPNYADGHLYCSHYLETRGRKGEASEHSRSAYELDPMSPVIISNYADSLASIGQFELAVAMHHRAVELSSPGQWNTYVYLGNTYERAGKYPEAIAEYQKAMEISGRAATARTALAHAYALSGKKIEAGEILNDLQREGDCFLIAYVCTALGRKDEALNCLEKLYQGDRTGLFLLKAQWEWDPLRSDPRFQSLLRRLGLPPDEIRH
jgi:TolB-like protein/Tfp pilus assembly protein PilF